MKVCITTAGLGTRMGRFSGINKALLPLKGRAAITHIIEAHSGDDFVIALGYQGQQVRDFIALAHPDISVEFVEIERYEGDGTGPLLSLYGCRDHLREPFRFYASDSITRPFRDTDPRYNTILCDDYSDEPSYCRVVFDTNGIITKMNHDYDNRNAGVFTGVMQIGDFDIFWECARLSLERGDAEIYHAINRMVASTDVHVKLAKMWTDIGTEQRYLDACSLTQTYDFSKPGEFFYQAGNRVIKWFADEAIAAARVHKASLRPEVFPEVIGPRGGFYAYPFVEGKTLYVDNDVGKFIDFLQWMVDHVWAETEDDIQEAAYRFYHDKTLDRLAAFRERYPDWVEPTEVNGLPVRSIDELLDLINLKAVGEYAVPSFIHGDLQFDNVIHGPAGFKLIDWRQDFGGNIEIGDIHYDIAKLLGGIRINYQTIKSNNFTFRQTGSSVMIDSSVSIMAHDYEVMLMRFVREQALSTTLVEQIVGLIYLNMAPLHCAPFDKFLYALAQQTLTETLN